ncbi:MAG TPA: hypothetical protein VGL10_07560 [Gammaproteobacteria bacterium]
MSAETRIKRYFEWMISLIMLMVVVLVFFVQINKLSAIAERESIQQTLSTIRLGMQFYALKKIVVGEVPRMEQYADTNPLEMLQQPPANYAGEFTASESSNAMPGQWYYDTSAKQLVYRVAHYPLFDAEAEPKELRYQLQVSDAADDAFSLRLLAVEGGS